MTTAPALRPCPFCGGAAQSFEAPSVEGWHHVGCGSCQATSGCRQTEADAIAAWNARPGGGEAVREAGLTRIFFDTEFIEDGKTIDLISIGMVRDDGETYYAESSDCDLSRADQWVKDNVLIHLRGGNVVKSRRQIAADIVAFAGPSPEFWAYYADYDWVVLCQLYGRMIDLPNGWPMFCRDLKQLAGDIELPQQLSTEHHALADAVWASEAFAALRARAQMERGE